MYTPVDLSLGDPLAAATSAAAAVEEGPDDGDGEEAIIESFEPVDAAIFEATASASNALGAAGVSVAVGLDPSDVEEAFEGNEDSEPSELAKTLTFIPEAKGTDEGAPMELEVVETTVTVLVNVLVTVPGVDDDVLVALTESTSSTSNSSGRGINFMVTGVV